MKEIYVSLRDNQVYITLQSLLQFQGIISTGGSAKAFLENTVVEVNGEKENRRGRKLYPGDQISLLKQTYIIKKNDS